MLACFDLNEVSKPHIGYKKPKVVTIWATCILCKYKTRISKRLCEDKITNCPSWSGCVEHVQNLHYLHDKKDWEETLTNPKAHWDDWKIGRRGYMGWRPGYKGRARWTSAWRDTVVGVLKRNVAWRTWHACVWWIICLCISAPSLGF